MGAGIQLKAVPWCQRSLPQRILDHPPVGETWRLAQKAFRDFPIAPTPSPLTPIVGNQAFSPGLNDPKFQELKVVERSRCNIFLPSQWKTKQQIMDDPALEALPFWQKLQLAHFFGSLPAWRPFQRRLTSSELLCLEQSLMRHTISQTYQLLLSQPPDFRSPFVAKWKQELGIQLTEKQVDRLFLFS